MSGAFFRLILVGVLVLTALVFLVRGAGAFVGYGVTSQVDTWVQAPAAFTSTGAMSAERAVVAARRLDPWNPSLVFDQGRIVLWLAGHEPSERAARMTQAAELFRAAIEADPLCGLCRLQLSYVTLLSGGSPSRAAELVGDANQLIGREWYAMEPIARLASLGWGWFDEGLRDDLVVTFAFHLPHVRETMVPILEGSGLWERISPQVMAERTRQSRLIRQGYGMEN